MHWDYQQLCWVVISLWVISRLIQNASVMIWSIVLSIFTADISPSHRSHMRVGYRVSFVMSLTHWGRVMHICVSKQTIIGSDNGLSPGRHQAIIWTNAGILLIGTLGTNFSEILIKIQIFLFKKMGLNVSSVKWQPFGLGLNVLNYDVIYSVMMILHFRSMPARKQCTLSCDYMCHLEV